MNRIGITLLAFILTSCSHSATVQNNEFKFFGLATLKENGDICLQMRSQEAGKPVAEIFDCISEADSNYSAILKHVSPIEVGQEKEIEPFE